MKTTLYLMSIFLVLSVCLVQDEKKGVPQELMDKTKQNIGLLYRGISEYDFKAPPNLSKLGLLYYQINQVVGCFIDLNNHLKNYCRMNSVQISNGFAQNIVFANSDIDNGHFDWLLRSPYDQSGNGDLILPGYRINLSLKDQLFKNPQSVITAIDPQDCKVAALVLIDSAKAELKVLF